jgi:putative AlgH/UPF0301 family transcriptional regulator
MRGYIYIILAALLMWLPSFAKRYEGHTGKTLVAYKMAHGNYFENAVIYIVAHGAMGATGFVQGDQFDVDVAKKLNIVPDKLREAGLPIFKGGPVGSDTTFFVLEQLDAPIVGDGASDDELAKNKPSVKSGKKSKKDDTQAAPAWKVYDFLSTPQERKADFVDDIINSYKADDAPRYVLFVGYAGWSPTQLEFEIWRGSWLVMDDLDAAVSMTSFSPADALWLDAFKKAAKNSEKKLGKIY